MSLSIASPSRTAFAAITGDVMADMLKPGYLIGGDVVLSTGWAHLYWPTASPVCRFLRVSSPMSLSQ